jgi:hypothetical protein
MKKIVLILLVVMLLTSFGFSVAKKKYVPPPEPKIVVFGDLGLAVSDFKGLFLDAGVQYALSKNLFGEFLFDFYLKPLGAGLDFTAYGFNLNGVYKYPLQDKLNLFGKAGVNFTTLSGYGVSGTDFGINVGGGVEYNLSDTMGIRAGGTFKMLFESVANISYFKFYGGFFYKL